MPPDIGIIGMQTLYIDNNVLGQERYWPDIKKIRRSDAQLRVVISDWHMVELADVTDRQQRRHRMDFIDSVGPLWMRGYIPIQKSEVRRFVWKKYYNVAHDEPRVFTEYLSEVLSDYVGSRTPIGINARTWGEMVKYFDIMKAEKHRIIGVLKTLQDATLQQKKQAEEETFLHWIISRVPGFDPNRKAITNVEKDRIARFCYENRNDLRLDCPAIAVENQLYWIRSRDATRKPQESDAIDLPHAVLALSYCDFYITRDGFARHCAAYAKRALPSLRLAGIHESLAELFPDSGGDRSVP